MNDEYYMNIALQEARKARLADEVPVGALIVDPQNGQIIAKARNKTEHGFDPSAHAEICAIRKAARKRRTKRLWGLDLYVTLEPCAMCAAAASMARLRRIVFGAEDSKGGAVVNGVRFYEADTCHHCPEIVSGVLAENCSRILKDFFHDKRLEHKPEPKDSTFG